MRTVEQQVDSFGSIVPHVHAYGTCVCSASPSSFYGRVNEFVRNLPETLTFQNGIFLTLQ